MNTESSCGEQSPIEQRHLTAEATAPIYRALTEEKLRQGDEGGDLGSGRTNSLPPSAAQPVPADTNEHARAGSALFNPDEDPTVQIEPQTLAEVAAPWRAQLEKQRLVEPKEQSNANG